MRRPNRSRRKSRRIRVMRLWKYPEAVKARPYLSGVLGSLRDDWLDLQQQQLNEERLADKKADRTTLIRLEDTRKASHRASERFRDSLRELRKIDVFLLDPVQGIAFIPFQKEEELAWMIYDRFDENGLVAWRLHSDPIEQRRPIEEITALPDTPESPEAPAAEGN